MNKTDDIEAAVPMWLGRGPLTVDELMTEFDRAVPGEDPRWLGVAMMHLERDGKVQYTSCGPDHSHDGACVIEVLR